MGYDYLLKLGSKQNFDPEVLLRASPSGFISGFPFGESALFALWRYTGWYDLNRLFFLEQAPATAEIAAASGARATNPPLDLVLAGRNLSGLSPFHRRPLVVRQTMTRAAYTALAVERYRKANGEFPDTLDVLVPEYLDSVPEDASTLAEWEAIEEELPDASLRYRLRNGGYVIYGLGPDCDDDGGAQDEDIEDHFWDSDGDIVISVRNR